MMVGGLNSRLWDKEENKCHFNLCALSLSLLSFCIGIECFLLPSHFFSRSFFLAFELYRCTHIALCSIIYSFRTRVCMLYYANSITVLQCTSSSSITTTIIIIIANYIRQNMFVHMQRHASEERERREKARVDLLSVLHMHTK